MSNLDFSDFLDVVNDDPFEEEPVDLKTFIESEDYLNLPNGVSELQFKIIEASTQVYRYDTLKKLYGKKEAKRLQELTYKEVICQLGKGCQTKDSRVWSPELGYVTVESLIESPMYQVETQNGSGIATEFFSKGVSPVYKVVTNKGHSIKVSPDHRFLSGDKFVYLKDLNVGDKISIKKGWSEPTNKYEVSPQEARAIGYMVGDKEWNYEWLRMSDENLGQLINGIWATDGWASIQRRSGQTSVQMCVELNSESLAKGIHTSLHRLGIESKFYASRPLRNNGLHNPTWRVSITSMSAALKFFEKCGFIVGKEDKCKEIVEVSQGFNKVADNSNYYLDKVVSIEYVGEEEVYTCSVEREENYLSEGMIHHNSGKNFLSTISVARTVYLLMCLKEPAEYFGQPRGDNIDIINIAVNADQAKRTFFDNLKQRIENSPWFRGKFEPLSKEIKFNKNINCYSGHSKSESQEGYNLILAILDEIAGFDVEDSGNKEKEKTADDIYRMFRDSVDSRYPDIGKVVLLSFPRYKGDFIQLRYDKVVQDVNIVERSHRFKIHEDIEDGIEDNEFVVNWTEDHILQYAEPHVFALKRASWEVNPNRKIEHYANSFLGSMQTSLMKFACMPPDTVDAYFRDPDRIEQAFTNFTPVFDDQWRFLPSLKADPEKEYFLHIDLGFKRDRAAVAMSHVESWVSARDYGGTNFGEVEPVVVVDALRWWEASSAGIDFTEIKNYVYLLRSRGFRIGMVTFDRWQSLSIIQDLTAAGIEAGLLSVAKSHYDTMAFVMHEGRLKGPYNELLIKELKQLRDLGKTVDHPKTGCFVGETRIPLLDGSRPMISELVDKDVWVYSCDQDGVFKPGKAKGKLTKHVDKLLDVVLDSGAVIRCTPEHLYMLRDGEYKEAKDLRPGIDELMSVDKLNHKVRDIIEVKLQEPIPVYDLEVEKWDNFALAAGVIVHNSKDLCDATCGSIFNAVTLSERESGEIELLILDDQEKPKPVDRNVKKEIDMPEDISNYINQFSII